MTLNEQTLKGKWLEIKGEVQKTWDKLTMDELNQTKGDLKAIAGLVQQKYGVGREQFQDRLSQILNPFRAQTDSALGQEKPELKH